ncbi:MAG: hypothetical protein JWN77_3018, partial [Frankiales bacterium]|nr:hypothetical protein [Frankiales bacterium]
PPSVLCLTGSVNVVSEADTRTPASNPVHSDLSTVTARR